MADKDTRDDFETRGDPMLAMPDGPRSEGGPVGREPEPAPEDTTPKPASELSPATGEDTFIRTAASEAPASELSPSGHEVQSPADPVPVDASGVVQPARQWSQAIATALSEPDERKSQSPHHDGTAFTDAVEGLFRPGSATPDEETHLITTGRRLNPALMIPKPEVPNIGARLHPEPAFEEKHRVAWRDGTWKDRAWIVARYAGYAAVGYLALVVFLILVFRFVNPPGSMLMLTQMLGGTAIDRTWAPLDEISQNLVRAVVVSEDGRFCEHSGIDTAAMREAIDRAARGTPRGASTISMQVTKNLFLWNAKSYLRKVIEIPLTLLMEIVWPKQRVLEVYLNIAEWGPGIFGAEAAARHHFGKRAADLSEREASLLAAVLPNPLIRDAGSPNRQTSAKARVVQARMRAYGAVASCVTGASPASAQIETPAAAKSISSPRKTTQPQRPRTQPRRKQADDWAPTLQFGPR